MRYLLAIVSVSTAPLFAQALVSNTIAISSGSVAGSYAGKSVQKNVGTIFSKTGETLETGGKVNPPKWNTSPEALTAPAANMPSAPFSAPSPKRTVASRRHGSSVPTVTEGQNIALSQPVPAFLIPQVEAPLPGKPVSREMLAEIVTGTSRDELIARLGTPASRVSIPSGGTLEEIFYYTNAGEILGAVRVIDDSVSRVQVNQ